MQASLPMKTRLTLNLDAEVIKSAKAYAKKRGITLSKLVEDFLRTLNPAK